MKLHIVPAKAGLHWMREGLLALRAQPMRLTALFVLFMLAGIIFSVVPLVGSVLSFVLMPYATVVLMLGALHARQGKPCTLQLVFTPWQQADKATRIAWIKLGGLYALFVLAVLALTSLLDDGVVLRVYLGQQPMTQELQMSRQYHLVFWLMLFVTLLGSTLLMFAPGLVYRGRTSALQAVFYSLVACKRNFAAVSIYVLAWGVAAIAMMLMAGAVMLLLAGLRLPLPLAAGLYFLLMLMYSAAAMGSVAFALHDCFEDTTPPVPSPPAGY